MIDLSFLPQPINGDLQAFACHKPAATITLGAWKKPRGCAFAHIFVLGCGGNGGSGSISVAGTAGGSGGGSGGQSSLVLPLLALPDVMYVVVNTTAMVFSTNINSVSANYAFLSASHGGAASGATVGAAGAITAISSCWAAGVGKTQFLVGQAGTNTANLFTTLPATGLRTTGGAAGAAAPAAGAAGAAGNAVSPSVAELANSYFRALPGGDGGATDTANGGRGLDGIIGPHNSLFYGGSGGGSGGGTGATVGGNGGNGSFGAGGGGGASALTGTSGTAGVGGAGGPCLLVVTCW